jgi:thiamine biosynthesis lipoprotein
MHVINRTFLGMNTRFDLILPGLDEDLGDYILDLIEKEVIRIDQKLSLFIPDSEISHINRDAFNSHIKIDDELIYIIKHCLNYHEQTEGAFDVTMRPLMDFWKNHETGIENEAQALEIKKGLGSDKIVLNQKNKTIHFSSPDVMIDLGAFGKVYALHKVKLLLKEHNISSAFISFGGSTIMGVGNHPYGTGWKAGLSDFFDFNANLYTFELHDQVLSVSGNNRTAFMRKEILKGHIISPYSAMPVEGMAAVASVSLSALDAEALSTSLFVANEEQRRRIIHKFPSAISVFVKYDDQNLIHIKEIN